ncbi:MAG: ester cyclase [Chloroflexota bacterium]|nr:ester cyclase [Chloroflexota bacterium]
MDKEERIIKAAEELISKGNLDSIVTHFSTDYIAYANEKQYRGHDFLRRWSRQIHSAIGEIAIKKILFLCQEGDTIAWQRTLTGVHSNELRGIPATGKKITWTEMVVSTFNDDKISKEWVVSELAGALLLHQSGAGS